MNLEPGNGFVENRAVEQAAVCPLRRLQVQQPRLEGDDLLQPLDVTACNRQHAEFDSPLQCVR